MSGKDDIAKRKEIGDRIIDIRKKKHISQTKLAKYTNISNSTICSYEKGRDNIGIDNFVKIAEALDVSLDELYYGDREISSAKYASSTGEKIITCVELLSKEKIFAYSYDNHSNIDNIEICKFKRPIAKFISALNNVKDIEKAKLDINDYLEQSRKTAIFEIEATNNKNEPVVAHYGRNGKATLL